MVSLRRMTSIDERQLAELSDLVVAVVDQGASVGYLPPLDREEADAYWRGVTKSNVRLIVAEDEGAIVGAAQLELATKINGNHRAEVNKVLVHPNQQRRGIGRLLMEELERIAREEKRTLLHLDTREGDPSNRLYLSVGYVMAGRVPNWTRSSGGNLDATVFYYRLLD